MSESYSLQDLFKAGLTREQFISKYGEIKNSGDDINSSIFGDGMESSLGQMFDTINIDGNETIDEKELAMLKAYSNDGDDDAVISEKDLTILYNKIAQEIKSQYKSTDPQQMYNIGMAGGNPESNTYIQDLSNQIDTLNELISSRQANASTLIDLYQNKIDDLVQNSKVLDREFKKQYKEASEEVARLEKEQAKQNSLIQVKSLEISNLKRDSEYVSREMESLNPDTDSESITSSEEELAEIAAKQAVLSSEYSSLVSGNKDFSTQLTAAKAKLAQLTQQAQLQDADLKSQIDIYKNKISIEDTSAKADVSGYQKQVSLLQAAQMLAISKLPKPGSVGQVDESSFHKNDNLMSFDELSKQGLKYSGAKGQKLAQDMRNHVVGFTGYCARHVRKGLERTGLSSGVGNASAWQWAGSLRQNKNFKEIKITSQEQLRSLPAGCVVVYAAGAARYSAKHGHIEVTLGNGTAASDGITRNMRYTENMSVFVPVEQA